MPKWEHLSLQKLILIQSFQKSIWKFFFLRGGMHIPAFQDTSHVTQCYSVQFHFSLQFYSSIWSLKNTILNLNKNSSDSNFLFQGISAGCWLGFTFWEGRLPCLDCC